MSRIEKVSQCKHRGREIETHRPDLNRSTAHLWFLFLAACYGFIAFKNLQGNPIGHDELIYLVKSWWIFSGQLDWYSDSLPLSYLPGAYTFPGLSQYILGQGLLEARFIGYVSSFLTLYLVFLYGSRIASYTIGLLSSALLIATPEILNWGDVSTYGISSLLIISSLIACSEKFVNNLHIRVIVTGILFSLLLFTRLNHAVTVALLLPILYLSQHGNGARVVFYVVITTILTSLFFLLLLPGDFVFQISSLGVVPFFLDLFSIGPPDYLMSHEFTETSKAITPNAFPTPSTTSTTFRTPPDSAIGSLFSSLSTDLYFGIQSVEHNSRTLAFTLGIILIGSFLTLLLPAQNSGNKWLQKSFAIGFLGFIFISFFKGHSICSSCPVLYSHYFIVPGSVGAAFGYWAVISRYRPAKTISIVLSLAIVIYVVADYRKNSDPAFSAEQKSDLATLAKTINEIVPDGEKILPVGALGGVKPIRMGLYLSDRHFPPQLLNPVFTFRPYPLEIKITEEDRNFFSRQNYWTPHHLLAWIHQYNYIIKPTFLYFDDHKYKYWFRSLYYPKEARDLLDRYFSCGRIPGHYSVIPPIDLCVRTHTE